MKFIMEEFWNDNLNEGIMADIMLGIRSTSEGYADKKRYKSNDKYGRSVTDRNVKFCNECNRLWELIINDSQKFVLYVPTCNSIRIGKGNKRCPRC